QLSAGSPLPTTGKVFLSVKNRDKRAVLQVAKRLAEMGFSLVATSGTAKLLARQGMTVEMIHKVAEGYRPNIVDLMKRGEIALDVDSVTDAERLVERLDGVARRFKIGSQLFTASGPAAVEAVHKRGGEVFLDLKFHDIPNTVAGAAREATRLGVFMFNVHAS